MPEHTTQDGSEADPSTAVSVTDPAALADHAGVEHREETNVHDDENHCEADVEGRTVVGVTDEDGALLLRINRGRSAALLPNEKVRADEDWAAVGRRAVEALTGLSVRIDAPVRVRRVKHVVEGEDEPHATAHHVVFEASPETARPDGPEPQVPDEQADEWEAEWFDAFPTELTDSYGPAEDDIRLFLD
jgi:hypothetical protein